ncbi:MAG: corrinoid protein [Planctomycetota bacterium]
MMFDDLLKKQKKAVLDGDKDAAGALARMALDMGADLLECIEKGYGAGIREVGELWEAGEYFLPELVQGAEAMKAAMSLIQPALREQQKCGRHEGTVVIGSVEGDIHDIGKSLVATFLEANGFRVFDLGKDVPLDRFIETAERESADLICLSSLLTTTMAQHGRLIERLKERSMRHRFAVMVGGAPVTRRFAESIEADGYGTNAMDALNEALKIMEKKQ